MIIIVVVIVVVMVVVVVVQNQFPGLQISMLNNRFCTAN